jgi:hypothetical protein
MLGDLTTMHRYTMRFVPYHTLTLTPAFEYAKDEAVTVGGGSA